MTEKLQRLELTWPGKEDRFNPEPRILLEDKKKSYSRSVEQTDLLDSAVRPTFDNMLIHGDNLLALKALEQDYSGKIKCIYIDPPYNTGNAFEHYDDGLEHSIWLSLMRDRLEILKRLLAEDGVIFVHLDDNEQAYCKVLMDEIFGRNNFVANLIWRKKAGGGQDAQYFAVEHENILVFKKASWAIYDIKEDYKIEDFPKKIQGRAAKFMKLEKWGTSAYREDRPSLYYSIKDPDGNDFYPVAPDGKDGRWRKKPETLDKNHIYWEKRDNKWKPYEVIYFDEMDQKNIKTRSIWLEYGNNTEATNEMKNLFGNKAFSTPKPEKLISQILQISTNPGDLVLDSFLGSGTTAAVAQKMGRRWIGVEMGDHVYTHCIPRLKKVIDGEDQGGITKAVNWQGGGGFKFYELASSLIVTDKYGQQIISKEYNADMLAEAMCKILGYRYKPDKEIYWKQGFSSEKNFIYTTTMSLQESSLDRLAEEIGDNNLLICCSAFVGNSRIYPNISVKKIPAAILKKCEWGREGYPLNLHNYHPTDEEFEFEEE
jgi:adenine-specific DNA-methyltransferase